MVETPHESQLRSFFSFKCKSKLLNRGFDCTNDTIKHTAKALTTVKSNFYENSPNRRHVYIFEEAKRLPLECNCETPGFVRFLCSCLGFKASKTSIVEQFHHSALKTCWTADSSLTFICVRREPALLQRFQFCKHPKEGRVICKFKVSLSVPKWRLNRKEIPRKAVVHLVLVIKKHSSFTLNTHLPTSLGSVVRGCTADFFF